MKYPVFMNLENQRIVVIGAGSVGTRKVLTLTDSGARIVVVSEEFDQILKDKCLRKEIECVKARYSKEYLVGAVMAFAATNNRETNEQIYKDCQELEVLCNVPDNPDLCDFFVPAVVKRGDLQIAVCTEGNSPAYAGHIRKKLEEIFTEKHGEFLAELEQIRKRIIDEVSDMQVRKAILGELAGDASFDYFIEKGPSEWEKFALEKLNTHIIKI
ncbi:MAG: bifunctional precorrin-2 dehydrogenase/sirohydrochlorin ferrochelatase [Phycisphaerales bacterium]